MPKTTNRFLCWGACANFLIAALHITVFFWPGAVFALTGIGEYMAKQAATYWAIPYVLTMVVMAAFVLFGLYGLSAAGAIKPLPLLKLGIYGIAVVYLIRGAEGLIMTIVRGYSLDLLYSLVAIVVGLLYLFGGFRKWPLKQ